MNDKLRKEFFLLYGMFQKTGITFSLECEMQINEMAILHDISGGCSWQRKSCTNLNVPKCRNVCASPSPPFPIFSIHWRKKELYHADYRSKRRAENFHQHNCWKVRLPHTALPMNAKKGKKLLLEFGEDNKQLVQLFKSFKRTFLYI